VSQNNSYNSLKDKILSVSHSNEEDLNKTAMEVFYYQYQNNELYRRFCDYLKRSPFNVNEIESIPFMPVSFFKNHKVITGNNPAGTVFKSSGTTGMQRSNHYVTDMELYVEIFRKGFAKFYGSIKEYAVFALLPSYLEQGNSSLAFMVDRLIKDSGNDFSGFYLNAGNKLVTNMKTAAGKGYKVLLLGVTYALLDMAENHREIPIDNLTVMETGGMKGRRREMVRSEVHNVLKRSFGVESIHSEYGMTELMSQAYSQGDGIFTPSDTMKIMIRDTNDPLGYMPEGRPGGINIIDLGNINSCSFIATQDLGKILPQGGFEVLGRFDNSDLRGCNLMVE
jgi:phenylacetate-coenzyme A ligase PaaK-like adenylate-forming protein